MSFSELVGKKIEKIYLLDDFEELIFEVALSDTNDNRYYLYRCLGECCNEVYINSINGLSVLIGETVLSTEHKISGCDGEGLDWDFWTISTNKGYCDIEIRNSSPSYSYDGDIYFKGNPDNLVSSFGKFKELTQDL